MIIVKGKHAEKEKSSGGIFMGTVEITSLIDSSSGSKELKAAIVTFLPGSRNKFHIHDHDQILYILKGKGKVATDEEEKNVTAGDIVLIPAGENHWHGATKDSTFIHLYVTNAETKTTY